MTVFEDNPAPFIDDWLDVSLDVCFAHGVRAHHRATLVPLLDAAFDVHARRSHDQHWFACGVSDEWGLLAEVEVTESVYVQCPREYPADHPLELVRSDH